MREYRAFLLSSGPGTRLRPLTELIPKPLVPIFHKPLLTFALDHLLSLGIDQIGVNTRYLWESFYEEFQVQTSSDKNDFGVYEKTPLHFFKETSFLDTGGSLRHARRFLETGTFLIHNGDILTNILLEDLFQQHRDSDAIATLLLREEGGALNVCYNEQSNRVVGIRGHFSDPEYPLFLYCGIAVVEPSIFNFIAPEGSVSLIDALLEAMKTGHRVGGFVSRSGFWSDIGTPESYLKTHADLAHADWKFYYPLQGPTAGTWPHPIHRTATIDPSATLKGLVVVGPHASIAQNAKVTNSILLPGASISANSKHDGSVILPSPISHLPSFL